MDWTAVKVITSSEAVEAVSYILTNEGAVGVQIDDAKDFANLKPGRYGKYTGKMGLQLPDTFREMSLFLNLSQQLKGGLQS